MRVEVAAAVGRSDDATRDGEPWLEVSWLSPEMRTGIAKWKRERIVVVRECMTKGRRRRGRRRAIAAVNLKRGMYGREKLTLVHENKNVGCMVNV